RHAPPSQPAGSAWPQIQLPRLAHQVLAEAAVRLRLDEAVAGGLVDTPRARQDAVGPQHDAGVAGGAREQTALLDQAGADAEAARGGLHVEQAQLGRRLVRPAHQEYGADHGALALGDPAALAFAVEALEEGAGDVGDKALEALVPAVLLGVERAMARH